MSALDIIATVKARGLGVRYDPADGAVVILSHGPAPEDVVKAIRAAKPQLVAFLKPDETGATGLVYWRVFNKVLGDATARGEEPEIGRISAFELTLAERLKHEFDAHGPPDDPTRCIHCGGGEANGDLLLPTGSTRKAGGRGCITVAPAHGGKGGRSALWPRSKRSGSSRRSAG